MTHLRHVPPIKSVMTPFPHAIDLHATALHARDSMQAHQVRHLPVKDHHDLVGIISERDLRDCDTTELPHRSVAEFYSANPWTVDIEEPLDNVLVRMAENHFGAVLVTHHGHLAGIFTAHDACRVLAADLRDRFRPAPGDDAA